MWLTSSLALVGASVLSKAYWNTHRPQLKHVHIQTTSQNELNRPLKVLHLTDIHVELLSVKPEKVHEMVRGQTFDFIALTGDYLDRVTSMTRFLHFLKEIVAIPNRYGVFAVWGNHDWVIAEQLPLLQRKMENLGVNVLNNESVTIQHGAEPVHIIGVDDHFSGHSCLSKAFADVSETGFRFVLTHAPCLLKNMHETFDYLICGHLHKGQVYYPLPIHLMRWGIKPFPKYFHGIQEHLNGKIYISAGLGQTGANLRLGSRPEVTIHSVRDHRNSHVKKAV